ncbi:class I SAM-dependent methyltransferase [Streptomyces sp. NPDC001652]|uniref:class I SAM-dependent methyltransferase n=1 Tax=Streptomyces sp. NPDC001652 TaxID=3154393 RepID=UPI003329EE23
MTTPTSHNHYDEKLAGVYDRMYPLEFDTGPAVDLLAELTPPRGRILELGVGTGRIALPLAQRGYQVLGLDASEAMLSQLKKADPEGTVEGVLGDFTQTHTGREFDLVSVMINTFFFAVTQEQQLSALRLVREQLAPGGRFLLEAFDPASYHNLQGQEVSFRQLDPGSFMLNTVMVERSLQLLLATHTVVDGGGAPQTTQHVIRYAFPSELDLLARLSGMRLVHRWEDWSKQPYTARSTRHVSVYARDDDPVLSGDGGDGSCDA